MISEYALFSNIKVTKIERSAVFFFLGGGGRPGIVFRRILCFLYFNRTFYVLVSCLNWCTLMPLQNWNRQVVQRVAKWLQLNAGVSGLT